MNFHKSASALKGQGPWDVIVVGSGMGGMACAAALAKFKTKVLLLEQHYVPGGFTHTFSRKGFVWDVGVHCMGEMGPRELPGQLVRWLSNDHVEMKSLGSVYETFHFPENFEIRFPDSHREFRKILEENFPTEKKAVDQYFELIRKVTRSAKPFFALRAMPRWIDQVASQTVFKEGRELWSRTTAEVLNEITSNEKLKSVLTSQWGYYGSTPRNSSFGIHALTARHFWNGGYYPVNGSQMFAEGFLKVISDAGGATCARTPVEQVIVRRGKAIGVRTSSGDEFFAPKVVSAVGARTTLENLVPEEYVKSEWGSGILSIPQSPSYVCLNMGFEGDILAAGATVSNQWFFESWDMELSEWDVTRENTAVPAIYLSFPSLKDPKHDPGPNQRHTGEAVTFVPWKAFEKWKKSRRGNRDPEYLQFKKGIEDRFLAQLRKKHPRLMERMVYHELSTPLSTQFFTRAPQGALYGLEATPKRFASAHLRTRTPIKNFYLAGSDVASLGVTGALIGGVLAAGTINPRVFSQFFR